MGTAQRDGWWQLVVGRSDALTKICTLAQECSKDPWAEWGPNSEESVQEIGTLKLVSGSHENDNDEHKETNYGSSPKSVDPHQALADHSSGSINNWKHENMLTEEPYPSDEAAESSKSECPNNWSSRETTLYEKPRESPVDVETHADGTVITYPYDINSLSVVPWVTTSEEYFEVMVDWVTKAPEVRQAEEEDPPRYAMYKIRDVTSYDTCKVYENDSESVLDIMFVDESTWEA